MSMACTWTISCPGPATHRMVQPDPGGRGGSVEFVCDHHVEACQDDGYNHSVCRTGPPVVPPAFWETADMRSALRSRHMGKIIRAYRHHPHHGYGGISQDEVARWAGISQGQVSRHETGGPLLRLDQLIYWSLLLGIPQQYLWFDLPDGNRPAASPGRHPARHA